MCAHQRLFNKTMHAVDFDPWQSGVLLPQCAILVDQLISWPINGADFWLF